MGSTLFRDPQARSSALATLGTLQPRAFRSLNRVETLDLVSNYYIDTNKAPNKVFCESEGQFKTSSRFLVLSALYVHKCKKNCEKKQGWWCKKYAYKNVSWDDKHC